MAQPTAKTEEDGHQATALLWLLVLTPFLYVLSFGPVISLVEKSNNRALRDRVSVLYVPIGWLHAHTILKTPLEEYYLLCGGGK